MSHGHINACAGDRRARLRGSGRRSIVASDVGTAAVAVRQDIVILYWQPIVRGGEVVRIRAHLG